MSLRTNSKEGGEAGNIRTDYSLSDLNDRQQKLNTEHQLILIEETKAYHL